MRLIKFIDEVGEVIFVQPESVKAVVPDAVNDSGLPVTSLYIGSTSVRVISDTSTVAQRLLTE